MNKQVEVKVYIWKPRANTNVLGTFRKGRIEVKEVPFHLWTKKCWLWLAERCIWL